MALLIKNGEIVTADSRYVADIYVEDETITRIGKNLEDTGSFAQFLNGTYASASRAKEIRLQNSLRRTDQIRRRDLLDKLRNIDVSRTRMGARRIVAVQTPVRLKGRFVVAQRTQ